MLRGAKH